MAIAPVGGTQGNTASTTVVITLTYTTTAGNTGVVTCHTNVTGEAVVSVVGGGGSAYTKQAGLDDGVNQSTEVWATAAGGLLGDLTTVVTWAAGTGRKGAAIEEYSGVAALGTTNTNSGTSQTPSVAITTQDANNYVVAGHQGQYDNSLTATTGTVRRKINAGTN